MAEASTAGLPVQRPLFLHFEDDARTYAIQDAYLYGADLLVAPVWQAGKTEWSTYLPEGAEWVHVWSGRTFAGGQDATVARTLRRAARVLPGGARSSRSCLLA